MHASATSTNCCDHGRSRRTARAWSTKKPGSAKRAAPIPATTRPTSAPSARAAAALSSPGRERASLSRVPCTYSSAISGWEPSPVAGSTSSTRGTGTCAPASVMTAASSPGFTPPRRTTTCPSLNVTRQVWWEKPPANARLATTVLSSTAATFKISSDGMYRVSRMCRSASRDGTPCR